MKAFWVVVMLVLVGIVACESQATHEPVDAFQFSEMIASDQHGIILDVRTSAEYMEGHIPDAKNMNYYDDNFESELDKLDKDKAYFVYCTVGGRSGSVATIMIQKGFKHVHDLLGGIDSWETNGLPITSGKDKE